MTLKSWLENHFIQPHDTSAEEITDLLGVVDRELADAAVKGLSNDGRMAHAYNATLQLSILALGAEGYRATRQRAHEYSILSLQFTIGLDKGTINLLDAARKKRNLGNYDRSGAISRKEADAMLQQTRELRTSVLQWLERAHPHLLESDKG